MILPLLPMGSRASPIFVAVELDLCGAVAFAALVAVVVPLGVPVAVTVAVAVAE